MTPKIKNKLFMLISSAQLYLKKKELPQYFFTSGRILGICEYALEFDPDRNVRSMAILTELAIVLNPLDKKPIDLDIYDRAANMVRGIQ